MYAFRKGVCPGPFCESIIRNRPRIFAEIRRRTVEHIASEGEVCEKRTSVIPSRPRAQTRAQPAGSTRPRRGERSQRGDAPMRPGNPSPGVQEEGIARPERGQGRLGTSLWWS